MNITLKLKTFFCAVLFIISSSAWAQQCPDTIYLQGSKCMMNGQNISTRQLTHYMNKYSESKAAYYKYTNIHAKDMVLGFTYGFALGYGIAPFLFGTEVKNQTAHLVLGGLGALGLMLTISHSQKTLLQLRKALTLYNENYLKQCGQ